MIITDVTIDYINQSNKPNRITKMFVDLDESNMTDSFIMNMLPDDIKKDTKLIVNIDFHNTELIL